MTNRLKVVSNGNYSAFLTEFGCTCGRCQERRCKSNTSVSVILENDQKVLWHGLFDVGEGIVDTISKNLPISPPKLDYLFFSHWHPDHTLGLNTLCETYRRSYARNNAPAPKIPSWCRQGTGIWLKDRYAYELNTLQLQTSVEFLPPGHVLDTIITNIGISITPITVSHLTADIDPRLYQKMYCSCCFVIKYENKKIVLLWDIDNKNQWIITPKNTDEEQAKNLLLKADIVFIDCNAWTFEENPNGSGNMGHISFQTVQKYVAELQPKKTIITHISGHEDGIGNDGWGWTNRQWQQEVSKHGQFDLLDAGDSVIL